MRTIVFVCAAVVVGAAVWQPPAASAGVVLRAAAAQTAALGGAAVAFDAAVNGPQGPKQASGSGTVSFTSGAAQFTFAPSDVFPGGAQVQASGDRLYVRAPEMLGTLLNPPIEWVSFPIQPLSGTEVTAPLQADDVVGKLREAGPEVVEAGEFVVNGVTATAYQFDDPEAEGAFSGKAYVDGDGLVRRLELDTADTTGSSGSLVMDLTASATPPEVVAPPAERTVDIAHVLAPTTTAAG